MAKVRLDNITVQTTFCPEGKNYIRLYCDRIPGFICEIRSSGTKVYGLRYRDDHGRQRQYKIGNVEDVSFDKARKQAMKIRSRVVVGDNPAEERFVTRRISTVQELSERYLAYVRTYKRSHDIDERYLRIHVLPKFGAMRLDELVQEEVVDWLQSKVDGGYAQSTVNRWQVILSHMFKMGKKWEMPGAEKNPLEGVPQKPCDNEIERFLTAEETQRLQEAVEASPNKQLKFIVAILILTGCRKRELLDATWDEFDLDRQAWRIPMERAKTSKVRHVPLSKAAIEVLQQIPRWEGCDYVVPNPKYLKPYCSVFHAWDKARKQAGLPDVRMHDLRHSAASNLVNSGQSLYVVAKILGHSQTRTTQRYAHLSQDVLLAAVDAAASSTGTDWARSKVVATPASV